MTHAQPVAGDNLALSQGTAADASPPIIAAHPHRWRIQEQGGARSIGVCECGAERLFANGWADAHDGQPSWGGHRPRAAS